MTAVFFDHDGGIDDFISLLLLSTYPDIRLLGLTVIEADTYIEAAIPASRKILDLAGRSEVGVATSTLGGRNPFPHDFRVDAHRVNDMPVLNRRPEAELVTPLIRESGQAFLASSILECADPVTLLMTGPLTDLAWALQNNPRIEDRIMELVVMGGAINVPGNVDQPGHDGSAEWNIYWDPQAAAEVWASAIPITLFSLDATNQVPIPTWFRRAFGLQYNHLLSAAAGSLWALTSAYPDYYCWDTLATSYLAEPQICDFAEVRSEIITDGPSQGRSVPSRSGRTVKMATQVDRQRFYRHCLDSLAR